MKRAAFFDVDGTLTTDRVWRGIMRYFTDVQPRRGLHLLFWAKHLPRWLAHKAGLLGPVAFRQAWAHDLTWYYKGLTVAQGATSAAWITREHVQPMLRPDSVGLVQQHLDAGDVVVLVSSGPTHILQHIATHLGVAHAVGTTFEVVDDRFTGRLTGPVCIADYKARMARSYLQQRGIEVDYLASHAYGDSASDIHLLELAGHPTAVYPDATLQPLIAERGWPVFGSDTPK